MAKEEAKKTNVSYTEKSSAEEKKEGVPPGATILQKTINTTTEEIENGFLITKSYDTKVKKEKQVGHTTLRNGIVKKTH